MKITINNEKEKLQSLYAKGYQSVLKRVHEVMRTELDLEGETEVNPFVFAPEINLEQTEVDEIFHKNQVHSEIVMEYITDVSLQEEMEQIKDIVHTMEKKYLYAIVIFSGDIQLMEISDMMEILSKMVQEVCMFSCTYSAKQHLRCKTLFIGLGK